MDAANWSRKVQIFASIAAFVFAAHYAEPSSQVIAGPQAIQAPDQFFDSDGVRIRYITAGKGEPIILIHGWAASAEMWDSAIPDLSRSYQVTALDCRGHGKSGKPTDPKQYGIQ